MKEKEDKKEKLLNAAQELFEEKGFEGVKMRELSEKAGVNKGLLHYYFKSKEAIFHEVFKRKADKVYLNFEEILKKEGRSFEEKISEMVDSYFELLSANPKLPLFILSEINKNSDLALMTNMHKTIQGTVMLLEKELKEEGSQMPGFQFLLSLISLCVFPFIMRPLIHSAVEMIAGNQDPDKLLEQRKIIIKKTLINSIKQ